MNWNIDRAVEKTEALGVPVQAGSDDVRSEMKA